MRCSLHSFTFFIKERGILCIHFGFISHSKFTNLAKKRMVRSFLGLQRTESSFLQYVFIYIYINLYISILIYTSVYLYIYLYIYIEKKIEGWACVLFKRTQHSAFFCKRMKRSHVLLRSLQKNIAFFAFFYVLKKRMQKNASFFWVS